MQTFAKLIIYITDVPCSARNVPHIMCDRQTDRQAPECVCVTRTDTHNVSRDEVLVCLTAHFINYFRYHMTSAFL